MARQISRDQVAMLAALAAPLALTAILIPFRLLSLSECRFQDGVAGIGRPPRLLRTGQVVTGGRVWDAEREGLPPGTHTELLAEAGGLLQGRFLLTLGPRTQLTLEQRLVAVALADQAAAALASGRLASRR
jgi:hypothetical protein